MKEFKTFVLMSEFFKGNNSDFCFPIIFDSDLCHNYYFKNDIRNIDKMPEYYSKVFDNEIFDLSETFVFEQSKYKDLISRKKIFYKKLSKKVLKSFNDCINSFVSNNKIKELYLNDKILKILDLIFYNSYVLFTIKFDDENDKVIIDVEFSFEISCVEFKQENISL